MSTPTIFETYGTIRADGMLELEQKLSPLPGRVKVRVESAESDEEFAKRFAELTAAWQDATRHSSKMGTKAAHPAYREIVAMGKRAVPLILADLAKHGGFWFMALEEITGANPPIPEGHRGNREVAPGWVGYDIKGMEAAWIAWGREQGYGC